MTEIRYLVAFSDGGVGMRKRDTPLVEGDELDDCGERSRVVRVEQPPSQAGFGRAWAERGMAESASSANARSTEGLPAGVSAASMTRCRPAGIFSTARDARRRGAEPGRGRRPLKADRN